MAEKEWPQIAKEGVQAYSELIRIRYENTDRIVQCIKEGNSYQGRQLILERNQLRMPGRIADELIEWKYDLIKLTGIYIYQLHQLGIQDTKIDDLQNKYYGEIFQANSIAKCKEISLSMVEAYCALSGKDNSQMSLLVQKILLAIDMDLTQPLTLQYFSKSLNVNDSYLSNLFRKETGKTLTEYVTDKRIDRARDLLVTTSYPIKMIAKQVGIPDVHYFSRIFKHKTDQTPSEYREWNHKRHFSREEI